MKRHLKLLPILITAMCFVGINNLNAQNFIQNGNLEAGTTPTQYGQIDRATGWGWADIGCQNPEANTPDLFDENADVSDGCLSGTTTNSDVGIPDNFRCDNIPVNTITNGNRYMGMFDLETIFNYLAQPLTNQTYFLQFYSRNATCLSSDAGSLCVRLSNGTSHVTVGTITFDEVSEDTDWTQYKICLNLSSVSSISSYDRIVFQYINVSSNYRLFDDFRLDAVDAGTDKQYCAGGSTQIGPAAPIPGVSYSWTPTTGLNNASIANPTSSATTTTTYTASVTVDGCTKTDVMVVTVNPNPTQPVISGDSYACDAVAETYTVPAQTGVTFNWTITGGTLNTTTGTSVNATWPSTGGTLSVTGTNNTTGCVSLAGTKTINSCCRVTVAGKTTIYYTNNNTISGTKSGTNFIYVLNTNTTVSSTTTFNAGAQVYVAKDVKVLFAAGATLNISNSTWKAACPGDMWDGIYVTSGCSLNVNTSSRIEDAKNAIVSQGGGNYQISGSTLNKNYKHVVVEAYSGTHPGTIKNSVISCVDGTGAATTISLAPHSSYKSYEGVEVTDVTSLQVGNDASTDANTFNNVTHGIYSSRTSLTAYNNTFNNCSYGINAGGQTGSQKTITVGGIGNAYQDNTFTNCDNGVRASANLAIAVAGNTFSNISATAIYAGTCNGSTNTISINSNAIDDATTGIYSFNNGGASTVTINSNIINSGGTNTYANSTGILAENSTTSSLNAPALTINSNSIDYVRNGIKVTKFTGPYVKYNEINEINDLGTGYNSYGIWHTNTPDADISENLVRQASSGSTRLYGISVSGSTYVKATCNTVDKFGQAIYFDGTCSTSKVAKNKMQNCTNGVYLGTSGVIGDQTSLSEPSDNLWEGTFTYHFVANLTDGSVSPFYLRNNDGTSKYPSPLNKQVLGLGAVTVTVNGVTSGTSGEQCSAPLKLNSSVSDALDSIKLKQWKDIAEDKLDFPVYDASAKWMSRYALWNELQKDTSIIVTEPIFAAFHDSHKAGNIAKLDAVNDVLSNGQSDMTGIEAVLNTIQPENDVEENLKKVLQIVISERRSGNYNTHQLDLLRTIASKCPFSDGFAVYSARVILAAIENTEYSNNCEPSGQRIALETNDLKAGNTKIYPNPANNYLTIELELKAEESANIALFNIIGEEVLNKQLKGSVNSLQLNDLNSGVYLYKILVNGKQVNAGKLSIIK